MRLGCTTFPKLSSRPAGHGGELLEVWDNKTTAAADASVALEVQNLSVNAASSAKTSEATVDPNSTSRGAGKRRIVYR